MSTILLLLLGFLTGTKLASYSKLWSGVALVLGLIQFLRLTFDASYMEADMLLMMNVILILSGISVIVGGFVTFKYSHQREQLLKSNPEKYQSISH